MIWPEAVAATADVRADPDVQVDARPGTIRTRSTPNRDWEQAEEDLRPRKYESAPGSCGAGRDMCPPRQNSVSLPGRVGQCVPAR
ncbi:hypothetical protein [Streptomyces rhizosphaerihabitans]|uniref:hypothetical protein n=1 Tax=Streptomyces rhizosphaerihabitans TaxID=1266770 RepID=UPI0021C2209C|nr:hypothetical protein [Streptomyces rhizosphaerihabitans]MCT9011288.1 hypothetical protein [Streptomyces rhizosphaerihabitans]